MEEKSNNLNDYQAIFKARIVKDKKQKKFDGNFYFKKPRQIRNDKGGKGGVVFKKDGRIRGWILTRLLSHGHKPDDDALKDPRGKRIDHYIFDDAIAELKGFLQEGAQASLQADSLAGKNMLLLEVTPSGAQPPFSRRRYWIDPAILLPVGYETFEESLTVEEIFFQNLKLNPGLKDDLF
jgi:outer membrane lipoprotein-sorting protein